jgi:dATP/dGTP diphosphohydrolase, N-terminal
MGVSISSIDEIRERLDLTPWMVDAETKTREFTTKDSGVREEYASGMRRDTQEGKPRFALLLPEGVPYEAQFLTRVAGLMERGAVKYGERNWEKASGEEESARFRESALRHMMQWLCGEDDEDHAAAVVFNLLAYESAKWKTENKD